MAAPSPLTLALELRRVALTALVMTTVAVVVSLTVVFQRGLELHTIEGPALSAAAGASLLDSYNGYSGTIASALARPLEVVVAIIAQLLVVRFLYQSLLRQEPTWFVGVAAVTTSAALGFCLTNGFNALNVQLRDIDIAPRIRASDLRIRTASTSSYNINITSINQSFPETQRQNALANTVLRNVVLPRVPTVSPQCRYDFALSHGTTEDAVRFGFPTRDWMNDLLSVALPAETQRLVINATNPKSTNATDLPMRAARGADLFLTAAMVSGQYIPWGQRMRDALLWNAPVDPVVWQARGSHGGDTIPTAVAAGLAPPEPNASEDAERVPLAVDPNVLEDHADGQAQYVAQQRRSRVCARQRRSLHHTRRRDVWTTSTTGQNLTIETTCGPWPGVCVLRRLEDDTPTVVHAYAACENADGSDTLQSRPESSLHLMQDFSIQCPQTSANAIIVVTASKRLTADAVRANGSVDTIVNPRKTYAITVSRLEWTIEDVAAKYNATCDAPDGCRGLDVALHTGQHLVVGAATLPLDVLSVVRYNYVFNETALHPFKLVTVTEPYVSNDPATDYPGYISGDLLLAHNVENFSLHRQRQRGECHIPFEDRQQRVLNDHLFIDANLQPTYTAAVFFLLQNAVVRDATVRNAHGASTLAFDGNQQIVALWISIPTSNAVLSCVGGGLLVVAVAAAVIWSQIVKRKDPLKSISEPHAIARVMLDTPRSQRRSSAAGLSTNPTVPPTTRTEKTRQSTIFTLLPSL